MHKVSRLFLLFSFATTAPVFAQQSAIYTNDLREYNKAVSLYKEKQYQAAQIIFEKVKAENENKNSDVEADCAYYIANCAIRLNQVNADQLMESFVED
mgnify:FL=1